LNKFNGPFASTQVGMNIIQLPDALNIGKPQAVMVYDYRSTQEIAKQQIILSQNTFSFLIEGTKEVFFEDASLSINNSQFILMKAGNCLMTEKLTDHQSYRSVLLFFNNETLLQYIRKTEINPAVQPENKSVFAFNYDGFVQRFVNSILDISKLSSDVQSKLIVLKFEEIMLYLSAIYGPEFLHSLAYNSNNATQKFKQTIESNQLSKLTIAELAFLCNMSISTFKREFEKHYAESPIKWFQHKRLEQAHYLITQEKKSATEIYYELGYENLSSFIQAYKSKYGLTPKQDQKN
jgi:AraC family transcriptional regulator, exoenzyme S synthesis regulatory protein ExsA